MEGLALAYIVFGIALLVAPLAIWTNTSQTKKELLKLNQKMDQLLRINQKMDELIHVMKSQQTKP